jgi:predicted DNA-binding transcriptional regulator AlpA
MSTTEYYWLAATDVAEMLRVHVKTFRDRLSKQPGFPKPCKRPGLGTKWSAAEVDAWVKQQRDSTGGRPRANA